MFELVAHKRTRTCRGATSLLAIVLGTTGCGLPQKTASADQQQSGQSGPASTAGSSGTASTGSNTSGPTGTGTTNSGPTGTGTISGTTDTGTTTSGTTGTGTTTSGTTGTGTTSAGTTGTSGTTTTSSTSSSTTGTAATPPTGASLVISPTSATVRLGATQSFAIPAVFASHPVKGTTIGLGTWTVGGGALNGTLDQNGLYTAPDVLPPNGVVTIAYALHLAAFTLKASATISLANPLPTITTATIVALDSKQTQVSIEGTGFIPRSAVWVDGRQVNTTFVDKKHLNAIASGGIQTEASVAVQVVNPDPGSAGSALSYIHPAGSQILTNQTSVAGGSFTLTFKRGIGLPGGTSVSLNALPLTATSTTTNSITVTGYLPPWSTGNAAFVVTTPDGLTQTVLVPIDPVIVPYDAAQRLAMQTAFGPRPDTIARIQKLGMKAFLDEQMDQPADVYPLPDAEQPQTHFLRLVGYGPAVLRQRTGWAFQTFIPESGFSSSRSVITWETTLEAHAFGSFKQILLDSASVPIIGYNLNLTGNVASDDPNVHPNQNFAREFMQLFSLGTVLLNEDGSPQLDASGNQQATYGEDTVQAMARVFTGWDFAPEVNSDYSLGTYDYSQLLVATERFHDHGEKVLFGNVVLPAGQSATADREQALEAVFQHPNLPPFISRILIQRFVKSQPSPAYVKRIVKVFKDNGAGVRGDLRAVIQAILLDPEARGGDTTSMATDGFLQDPLYTQLSAMQLLQTANFDDQPIYYPGAFGEPWWHSNSVFAYFSPSYIVPGTTVNSPEFQLLDDVRIVQRSQFLWSAVTQGAVGFPSQGQSSIYVQFPTLGSLVDALDHELYHGTMPQAVKDQITSSCSGIADHDLQLRTAVFLALSSDYYTVVR